MNSIDLLLQNSPPWVGITNRELGRTKITAEPPPPGKGPARQFLLELRVSNSGGVSVAEQGDERQLPPSCIERHINPDHTFCLEWDSEAPISDGVAAISWWSSLGAFLINQAYAERHGVWPLSAALSHGEAAREQLAMEAIADPLGWKDDILLAMFRGKGWLAEYLPRISKTRDRVVNARSPCPRGCTRKHKLLRKKSCGLSACNPNCQRKHPPILRADCPNRLAIETLILHEHQRRRIERRVIEKLAKDGHKCCGTMKSCPLRLY